jgi:hypothetical protein
MKPTVKYNLDQWSSIFKNRCAIVSPLDHPSHRVTNGYAVHTSTVISIDGDNFETLNTKYVGVHNGEFKIAIGRIPTD